MSRCCFATNHIVISIYLVHITNVYNLQFMISLNDCFPRNFILLITYRCRRIVTINHSYLFCKIFDEFIAAMRTKIEDKDSLSIIYSSKR